VFAQSTDSVKTTTIDTVKNKGTKIHLGFGGDASEISVNRNNDTSYHESKAPGFSFGVTFSRIDFGLATLVDNGSFTLSPANQFLNYRQWKTTNFAFDLLQFGYRFNSSVRIYAAGGLDWTYIRLRNDITILRNTPALSYTTDAIHYDKNRLTSSYVRIPVMFDFRSSEDDNGRRFHLVAGPEFSFLLNGTQVQKSKENGKQKLSSDYHFAKLRTGAVLRIGYGAFGLFGKYYFNDMFENSPAQKGLKNFSFGISLGW